MANIKVEALDVTRDGDLLTVSLVGETHGPPRDMVMPIAADPPWGAAHRYECIHEGRTVVVVDFLTVQDGMRASVTVIDSHQR